MEAMEKYRAPQPDAEEQRRRQAAENALFRVDVRRSLRLYRHVAIYTGGAVFAMLLLLALLANKRYSAEAFLSVSPSVPHVMGETQQNYAQDSLTYDNLIEQQMQLVRSYEVLAKTINSPGVKWREPKESEQAAIDRLAKAVAVSRVEKSYQIALVVTAKSADQAATIANTIAQNYLASSNAESTRQDAERLTALRAERAQLQAALDAKIAQQSALLQKLKIAPGSTTALDSEFSTLSAAAADAKVKHDAAVARLQALNISGADAGSVNDPLQNNMNGPNSLAEKRATLVAQMAGLTANHPLYKEDAAEIKQIDAQIAADSSKAKGTQLQRAQAQARTDLASATTQQAMLSGQLAAEAARVSKNTPDIEQSNSIANDIKRLEDRFGLVDDRVRNLELEGANPGFVQLTSMARPALHPNPNKRMLFLLMLLPGSLCAGIFAAVVALRLDPKIYSGADIEAITGYPPLAVLLHSKEASAEVMEEYLLRMAAGVESLHTTRNVHTMLVTGTSAETGASTLATALALKLQQVNRDSAVMDAEADSSAVSQDELRKLASQHGLVLVDAPPILSSARAEYLARFTDAVLLITESGRTTRDELRRAVKLLDKLQTGGVAIVLNKLTLASAEDQMQREVAELEQRILERGSASYTRPALRLFNTAQAKAAEPSVALAAIEPVSAVEQIPPAEFPLADAVPAAEPVEFAAQPIEDQHVEAAEMLPVVLPFAETHINANERLAHRLATAATGPAADAAEEFAPLATAAETVAEVEPVAEPAVHADSVEVHAETAPSPDANLTAEAATAEPEPLIAELILAADTGTPVAEIAAQMDVATEHAPIAETVAEPVVEHDAVSKARDFFASFARPEAAVERTTERVAATPVAAAESKPVIQQMEEELDVLTAAGKANSYLSNTTLDAEFTPELATPRPQPDRRITGWAPPSASAESPTEMPAETVAEIVAEVAAEPANETQAPKVTFFGAPRAAAPAAASIAVPSAAPAQPAIPAQEQTPPPAVEPLVPSEFAKAPSQPGKPITFGKRPTVEPVPVASAESATRAAGIPAEPESLTLPEKDGYKEFPDSGSKLFGFSWKRRPLVPDAGEPQPQATAASIETIEPYTPSADVHSTPETYVPLPLQGQPQAKSGAASSNGEPKKAGWMDRAEIERLIGKRKG